jgi:hypothetical protein
MKRDILKVIGTTSLLLLLLFPGCDGEKKTTVISGKSDLLATINASCKHLGLNFTADKVEVADAEVPDEGVSQGQVYSLSNVVINIDAASFSQVTGGMTFQEDQIPLKMSQMVLRYNGATKYLQMLSCKDFEMNWTFHNVHKKENKTVAVNVILMAKDVSFKHYNISPLLQSKAKTVMEFFGELMAVNPNSDSSAHNLVYQIKIPMKVNEDMTLRFEFAKMTGNQSINGKLFEALYGGRKDAVLPDLSDLLEKNAPVFDLQAKGQGFKVGVKMNDALMGEGTVADIDLAYFLKPDEDLDFYKYGVRWNMKDLKIKVPGFEAFDKLTDFQEMGLKAYAVHLTPGFVQSFFELSQKNSQLQAEGKIDELRKHQMAMGMKVFMEMTKSEPKIKFYITPFKHHLVDLEAKGYFRITGLSMPEGKAEARIKDFASVSERIKNEAGIPGPFKILIIKTLEEIVKIQEDGSGAIKIETKTDYPGQVYLNGKPMRK